MPSITRAAASTPPLPSGTLTFLLTEKWRWHAKITSREDALDAVKGSSTAFFVVGAIQVAVSFFLGFSILFDALKHFLSLIVLWAAILAVEATFKLRSRFALEPLPVEPSKA